MFEIGEGEKRGHEIIDMERGRELHDILAKKSCRESVECMQRACNEMFTAERREQMIEGASVDRKGRRVRYYRMIKKNIFLRALNEGGHSVENNHTEEFDRELPEQRIDEFFAEYTTSSSDNPDIDNEIGGCSLRELLDRITDDEEAKGNLLREKTNRAVVEFVEKWCDPYYIEQIHAGSMYPEFSPYLSVSVGGSPRHIYGDCVMLELVLPDDIVSSHPGNSRARQGEKHAYVLNGFSLDQISRVFASTNQYRAEVLQDNRLPVGEWLLHETDEWDGIEDWRWNESTDDCLPVGILRRYGIE